MADVYQVITDRIVSQLEKGVVPWRKPWKAGQHGWPKNLLSKREYRGVNVFMLSCTEYELPYWLTFRQAKEMGGHVRKGEKSTPVVFWKWLERETADGKTERIPLLRYYSLFNISQCNGLDSRIPKPEVEPDTEPFEPIAACERIVSAMPQCPEVVHGTVGAFYSPSSDKVNMPFRERFETAEGYYATLFHELTHSTGHDSRLNRSGVSEVSRFGSQTYSKEELIAECGAAFLCGHAGIENETVENSASYIAGWLKRLKDDRRLVVHAAAAAQKAADFILGRQFDDAAE